VHHLRSYTKVNFRRWETINDLDSLDPLAAWLLLLIAVLDEAHGYFVEVCQSWTEVDESEVSEKEGLCCLGIRVTDVSARKPERAAGATEVVKDNSDDLRW
jgi:hypothetical protein